MTTPTITQAPETLVTLPQVVAPRVRKPPLPALTGIRTLLALSILLFHFTPPHLGWLQPIFDNSFVFVGCFFLISGFVLAYNYTDRATTLVKRDFWVARFSRLYPTYLFVLLISLPLLAVEWQARSRTEFWHGLILTPLLLQGWSPTLATFWNTVAWTLSSEFMLYLAFPYIMRAWAIRGSFLNTPGRLVGLILLLWIVGIAPHTWYHFANPDHLPGPADRFTGTFYIRALKYTPPPYICTFLAGLTLGKLHLMLPPAPVQRFVSGTLSFIAILLFFYLASPRLPYVIVHGALLLPLFCVLILGLTVPNPLATVFAFRPLVILGEATYAIYLLHFNAYLLIHNYHLPERLHVTALDPWISYLAIVALAYFTMRFVETPSRKFIVRNLGSEPVQPTPA